MELLIWAVIATFAALYFGVMNFINQQKLKAYRVTIHVIESVVDFEYAGEIGKRLKQAIDDLKRIDKEMIS